MALAVLDLLPAAQQQGDLLVTADQRRQARRLARLEAPFGLTLAFDPPGGQRFREALEPPWAEVVELEHAAEQPARRLADHHAAGRRERLQSRREIGRLADHGFFARRAFADQLADHDQAGRDADPRRQGARRRRVELRDATGQLQSRSYRPLGLIFMRHRPAEVRQHAVAHVLGDVAVPAPDHPGATILIRADHPAHVLGIEPRRERGRADQIDEHHGQLPPLGAGGWRRWNCLIGIGVCWGPGRLKFLDRLQQQPAVAEGEAEFLQVGIRELRQDAGHDVIVAERVRVALEAQLPQPIPDVQDRLRLNIDAAESGRSELPRPAPTVMRPLYARSGNGGSTLPRRRPGCARRRPVGQVAESGAKD